jgi:O-antigen biosynthesis protein WbqP
MGIYYYTKRIFDFIYALFGLIILAPLFLIIGFLIKLDSRGPVFFTQRRIGKDKIEFKMLKFRTMKIDTPHNVPTHLMKEPSKYITRVGKILRKTSLDELPQFINILKGDMSFVGPRPALYNQDDLVAEREKHGVHQVLPGVTGWAQVNGRDTLPIPEKAKLDGEYIKHFSLWTDFKLLLKTLVAIIKSEGVVEGGTGALEAKDKGFKS